jgi:hypothetical protein
MMRKSRTVLVEYKDGHWTVRRVRHKRAPKVFATKAEAVAAAKAIAIATQPSQVTIIGRNGLMQPGYRFTVSPNSRAFPIGARFPTRLSVPS